MQLKNATVLVVDDEEILLELMAGWFARAGSRALQASDGAAALESIAANRVDLIVSDIRMPVMDGITLLKKVKASGQSKPTVIFVAGCDDIGPRDAYDLGAEALVEKPFERSALLTVAERSLGVRIKLWGSPLGLKTEAVLKADFDSLSAAMEQGLITFGHGGFCVCSTLDLREGPVELALNFKADRRTVSGQGIVRWAAHNEKKIGVEITYIDAKNRVWISALTEGNESASVIPRTTFCVARCQQKAG
jgi:CheY-like chemotaxis protein